MCDRCGHRGDRGRVHWVPRVPDRAGRGARPLDTEAHGGSKHGGETGDGVGQLSTEYHCQPT